MNLRSTLSLAAVLAGFFSTGFAQAGGSWTLHSEGRATDLAGPSITLPPGGELVRLAPAGAFGLSIESRPAIAAAPASWPVVMIGEVAVIVFASGGSAAVGVFDGGEMVHVFDAPLKFDAAGRLADPLRLTVERRGDRLEVGAGGEKTQLEPVRLATGDDIVLSAGSGAPWELDAVTFRSGPLETGGSAGAGAATPGRNSSATSSGAGSAGPGAGSADPAAAASPGANGTSAGERGRGSAAPAAATLEVFTPPAVRKARADAVRELVRQQN